MSLDIVISFDTTGSMYPCLAEVRRKVDLVVDNLFTIYPSSRIGILAHGDYCDFNDPYVFKTSPLLGIQDKKTISSFIRGVEKTGGGDFPECYELVLKRVRTDFDWKADRKVLVLIGDATPHDPNYSYNVENLDWQEEAEKLVNKGVLIYPVQALGRTESNYFYRGLAKISETPKLDLAQLNNITEILQAIYHKQNSDDELTQFGNELKTKGLLNRNLAQAINSLLNKENFIGGKEYASINSEDLKVVHPSRFQILHVDELVDIKTFVTSTGAEFKKGRGFYQLSKSELVQENKEVILRNDKGDMFSGAKAREMIRLPFGERGTVRKSDLPKGYEVYIQSTSYNRKLMPETKFLYEIDDFDTCK